MRVIGLMSGTSLDGVDAAWIETDGIRVQAFGPAITLPYDPKLRAALRRLIDEGEAASRADLDAAAEKLTLRHVDAVRAVGTPADLIGFHGQTILHAPERRLTWQIGNAHLLSNLTGLPVAYDFRLADVAAGGQGAPLAPAYHAALAAGIKPPLLVVNIGGVANLTFIDTDFTLLACDTGPGNALLDDWMAHRTGAVMDTDGKSAAAGYPDDGVLARLLADPFFSMPPPKSLDRQHFASALAATEHLSTPDGAATLAAFTARAIAGTPLPSLPLRALVTGGGRHNPAIMAALAAAMPFPVGPVEDVGWDGDALEAQCFAYLAARVQLGLPLSYPGTTGVARPTTGGRIVQPAALV